MQNPAYLEISQHHVFHYRWPVPQYLLPDSKRRYVKLSLRTREPQEALYLANGLSYAAKCLLKRIRLDGMDFTEIKGLVQTYLQRALSEIKQAMDWKGAKLPEVELYRLLGNHPDGYELGLFDTDEEARVLRNICDKMNMPISEDDPEWERLKQVYRAAIPQYCKEVVRYADVLAGDFDFNASTQAALVSPSQQKLRHAGAHTLGKVSEKFIAAYVNDEAWDENTKNDKQAKLAILTEILDEDFLVSDIDLMKAREVRDIIKQLPKNVNKNPLVRGKPVMEAIRIGEVEKISAVTAQKYLNAYNALFQWCVDEGMVHDNPFAKIKATVDKKKKSATSRKPFNADQISQIRAAALVEDKHYRKWGALIGLYTGARLNEVAQIMLDDIKQKEGIWYFHMNDEGENKRLKTAAARRFVPVHSELLKLGIIEETQRLRQAGHKRFLHELTFCQKNGYGKKLSHYFNAVLLPNLGIKRKELVFHSLRHTANTCLYQAGVSEPIVHMLIGHERSGTSQQVYFKEGYTLQQLKEAMDKFDPVNIVINSD